MLSVICRSVFEVPHVIWLDNYAHILRVNSPSANAGWWRNSLWSAKAAITLESLRDSDITLKRDGLQCMPSFKEIFSDMVVARFKKYFTNQEKEPIFYFDLSSSKNVRTVPIRPETEEAKKATYDRHFVPLGILGQNIGSNQGLFKILMDLRKEEKDKPHIPALLVDCNIYWRIMKVPFCESNQFPCLSLCHLPLS